MTVRARLLCLLLALAILFLAGALALRASEFNRMRQLSESDHREKTSFFTKILDLKGASLEALTYDYTYWDEMVQFVGSRDSKWASQNLDSALSTYKTDGIWVYRPRMGLVYSACTGGHDALRRLPITMEALRRAFAGRHFCHFFLDTAHGVVEIRGAEIHATKDEKRTGKSFGFFLTGRLWDAAYLKTLAELTTSHVTLRSLRPGETVSTADHDGDDVIDFYEPLSGWDGQGLACLHLAAESRSLQLFRTSSAHMMALTLVFITALLALLSFCLLHWVSSPLQAISRSLGIHDPEDLRALQGQHTEFGILAGLIERFFAQNSELEAAHEQLERRVA